ncbi:aminotransferase class I/II-fold pyridoxal phosphate-dependent enzyme [Saccharopolyspora sp. ID03-671]|uniref:aminotransferase class I/II-fold pyridoxal phosphate-dependent enzyme n=1 Tax=Saccharopolyspora sp. ID03-671 TaxID=3073066 RepID=UPI0032433E38
MTTTYPTTTASTATGGNVRIRLTHNESPFPPTPRVRAALEHTAAGAHRYPTVSDEDDLIKSLARHHEVPDDGILLGAGAAGLLQLLAQTCASPGAQIVAPWRAWEAYPDIATSAGARFVPVPLTYDEVDLDAVADAITERTAMVWLTHPHNPTGQALTRSAWERFLQRVPAGVMVVLDEAYYEFLDASERARAADGIATVRDLSVTTRLVVLRTFSKAYGLAGLRVGYAITSPTIARELRHRQLPFTVSTAGIQAALATMRDTAAREAQLCEIRSERNRLARELGALGYPVRPSSANMLWLPLRSAAEQFTLGLRQHGIIVRCWSGDGVRISVGTRSDHDALLAAARVLPR